MNSIIETTETKSLKRKTAVTKSGRLTKKPKTLDDFTSMSSSDERLTGKPSNKTKLMAVEEELESLRKTVKEKKSLKKTSISISKDPCSSGCGTKADTAGPKSIQ